jgi:myosin-9
MTLHDRTTKSLLHLHKKKKPPSISAQFQVGARRAVQTAGRALGAFTTAHQEHQ